MPINKNAMIRYHALDRCLQNRQKRFYINDLIDGWGLREVFGAAGLSSEEEGDCDDGDCILIGLDPSEMKDEQTLKEFKEVVVGKLKEIGLEAEVKDIGFVSGGTDSGGYTFIESCG